MITEYYKEFKELNIYKNVTPGLIRKFDAYLIDNNICLNDAYNAIVDFTATTCVSPLTRRAYRTRLRRYIEFVYQKQGIEKPRQDIIKMGGQQDDNN